ncbi:methyl-accepting chemotaxis protein [Xanthobacteraceae bacterium Astr-EGSB]|uniref:methyl-accepting chemotaxis protein n=1 Tax=Astrobacterium formosum TaxID=3069710 RepID=UPI0027AED584|nr:methyl-accepting chemotaxis protein [Xanthobacteraceae bacterium Astr-EGSB]
MFRLSIRSALIGLFVLMMAVIIGQGLIALSKISSVNDSVLGIGRDSLPSVATAHQINSDIVRYRLAETRHIATSDPKMTAMSEQQLTKFGAEITALRKKYDSLVASQAERDAYNTLKAHLDEYRTASEASLAASRAGDKERARSIYYGEGMKTSQAALAAAQQLVEINEAGARELVEAAAANYSAARTFTFLVLVIGVLTGFGAAGFSFFGVARPIGHITASMSVLANGNTDAEIPFATRKDEIGHMAAAVRVFRDNMVENRRLAAEQKEAEIRAAADKKATEERELAQQRAAEEKAAAERKAAMADLANDFEKAVGNIIDGVSSASTELEAAATTLTKTAETTQQLSTTVASASEQASSNVQSVASATEEMTVSVSEISRQVQESSTIANEAVQQAQQTDTRITELSHAASRIGDVVKLITAIAEQTNLLALNATIEAARAGEAGKGFAVVAQEVKNLASQTAKATGEIGGQITGMQAATQESVTAIKEIGTTISKISQIASTIAAAVEEQGAATQEIARNVQEAARGTSQVATNIVAVNEGAGETGSASAQVLASAQSLASESTLLKTEVRKFLATVRAA